MFFFMKATLDILSQSWSGNGFIRKTRKLNGNLHQAQGEKQTKSEQVRSKWKLSEIICMWRHFPTMLISTIFFIWSYYLRWVWYFSHSLSHQTSKENTVGEGFLSNFINKISPISPIHGFYLFKTINLAKLVLFINYFVFLLVHNAH